MPTRDLNVNIDGDPKGLGKAVDQATAKLLKFHKELEKLEAKRQRDAERSADANRQVGESAVKAGSAASKAFTSMAESIASTGPGAIALVVGAIAALPAAATLAAGGVTLGLGGALLALGVTAAASSDRVKREFSDLGADLKVELGDAASPLEDSAIHASGVIRETFAKVKPILREVFADLGPEVDDFIEDLASAAEKIAPSLVPLGDAFGTLLGAIGDRADDMGEDIADAITTIADTTQEHAVDIANLFAAVTTAIRMTADGVDWLADRWSEFLTANELVHSSLLGVNADYDGSQQKLADMREAMQEAITAAQGLGTATNESESAIRSLSDALEAFFDPAAQALDAEIRLKEAIKETTEAAQNQRLTGLERLKNVQTLTQAIAESAKAEAELTGETTQSTKAFQANIGKLVAWAGNNKNAQATVTALGRSLGVTITKTKNATYAVDDLGNVIKVLPNGKTVTMKAKTSAAKAAIQAVKRYLAGVKNRTVYLDIIRRTFDRKQSVAKQDRLGAESGALMRYASGGIERYQAGSVRRSTPPMIATRPTILFGEGNGDEAFIPYDPKYRSRAKALVGQVAADLGMLTPVMPMAAGGGTSGEVIVRLVADGDGDMLRMLRKMVRVEGRGNVQVAFGR
ncbi:hypothetical protein E1295_31855 [Nonomuraea mesophila]|uniref:Uncharacterized protein n=1 Tax=Nonomuraea mesophila TaxID=2530382 RepID=A0A4V2Z8K1_9ACTN|nr:hypothetical protein [Nonomuraea mesophila]TDE40496.1 hypothetical protein E1295_31855 [Nonomuraea mesophila]